MPFILITEGYDGRMMVNQPFDWHTLSLKRMNRRENKGKAGLFCSESRALGGLEPGFCGKAVSIHSKRRLHLPRKKSAFSENADFFFKYLYMLCSITYIVMKTGAYSSGFCSGCSPDMIVPEVSERDGFKVKTCFMGGTLSGLFLSVNKSRKLRAKR